MPIWVEQADEYLRKHEAHAAITEWEEVGEKYVGRGISPRVGDPVIVIGKWTGGEHIAHEIGHIVSGHRHPRRSLG